VGPKVVVPQTTSPPPDAPDRGSIAVIDPAAFVNDISAANRSNASIRCEAGRDGPQPVRSRHGIVVGDGHELSAGVLASAVERSNLPRSFHEHESHWRASSGNDCAALLIVNAQDHDHLQRLK